MNFDWFWTIVLSILPISELRGGIPFALQHGFNPVIAYFVCVATNIMAFPIVYFFLEILHPVFSKIKIYNNLFDKIVVNTRKKVEKSIEKYGFWGLMIFVMIPLPVTGAYSGTLASWLFNIDKKKSFLAVVLGVMIAGIIVTAVYYSGMGISHYFIKDVSNFVPETH